ncbi:MAG: AIR synthase related protein [Candidatus Uhrbacteria bacterium]|nr:AIR synthase related protein [Candidatus Uhrbacteria bacterium]
MQESTTESVPGTFITYQGSGVNYDVMDPFKIAAQRLAGLTASYCLQYGFQEEPWSRGESAYVMRVVDPAKFAYLADVNEGLGTKSVIADDYHPSSDTVRPHFNISIDNFAMCVNDLLTTGALPLVCAMHLAVGSSDWFENEQKWMEILKGWSHACDITECVWGGGETPTLKRIITPGEVLLSGSASGVIRSPEDVIRESRI